jgi:hypothetical protein
MCAICGICFSQFAAFATLGNPGFENLPARHAAHIDLGHRALIE